MRERAIIIGDKEQKVVVGHSTNKRHSKNPLKNMLLRTFDKKLLQLLAGLKPENILEIGCGEGYVVELVKKAFPNSYYVAVDIDETLLEQAKKKGADEICLSQSEPITLPYKDDTFDVVLMIEVLEHLFMPEAGLKEARRLTNASFIASVPDEPLWRLINILQCKHLNDWGNTPGHINHWGRREFYKLMSLQFDVETIITPFPWLMCLSRKSVRA